MLLCCKSAFAQDIHWSQYDHNPIFENPSNVGQFNGDYRFHANYKDQWRSVTEPFSTVSVSAEMKNIYRNMNIGFYFMHDVAGDGKMRTIEFLPSFSYTLKVSSDSMHLFRPAIQFGINNRSLDPDAFMYDSQWNGEQFDPSLPTNEAFATDAQMNFTMGFGLGYEYQQDKRHRFRAGVGLFNVNQPNQGFFGEDIRRKIRFNLFARSEWKVGIDWDILPSISLNFQGKYREMIIGSQARYILKDRRGEYRAVLAGIFTRTGDAAFITGGMEYQNWWVGLSYDINYSNLTPASRARGGFEISARYIIHHFKPQKIRYRACPDFI